MNIHSAQSFFSIHVIVWKKNIYRDSEVMKGTYNELMRKLITDEQLFTEQTNEEVQERVTWMSLRFDSYTLPVLIWRHGYASYQVEAPTPVSSHLYAWAYHQLERPELNFLMKDISILKTINIHLIHLTHLLKQLVENNTNFIRKSSSSKAFKESSSFKSYLRI